MALNSWNITPNSDPRLKRSLLRSRSHKPRKRKHWTVVTTTVVSCQFAAGSHAVIDTTFCEDESLDHVMPLCQRMLLPPAFRLANRTGERRGMSMHCAAATLRHCNNCMPNLCAFPVAMRKLGCFSYASNRKCAFHCILSRLKPLFCMRFLCFIAQFDTPSSLQRLFFSAHFPVLSLAPSASIS